MVAPALAGQASRQDRCLSRLQIWRDGEEVTRRSAKPQCVGSNPTRASKIFINNFGILI